MPPLKMSRSTVIKAPERVNMDRLGLWENMIAGAEMLTRNLKIRSASNYDLREMYCRDDLFESERKWVISTGRAFLVQVDYFRVVPFTSKWGKTKIGGC
jgi:hypothetical protein